MLILTVRGSTLVVRIWRLQTSDSDDPLTTGAVHKPIRFLHFLLAHYVSAFKHVKDKSVINQQDLKSVDLHFVKSE